MKVKLLYAFLFLSPLIIYKVNKSIDFYIFFLNLLFLVLFTTLRFFLMNSNYKTNLKSYIHLRMIRYRDVLNIRHNGMSISVARVFFTISVSYKLITLILSCRSDI